MTSSHIVGSPFVRAATIALAGLSGLLFTRTPPPSGLLLGVAAGAGVLALIGAIHSSRRVFAAWMRFAEALHTVVIAVLFSACYLLIVPLFAPIAWMRDPLLLRRRPRDTAWVTKSGAVDLASLERMG
jgi:hypothetical protein